MEEEEPPDTRRGSVSRDRLKKELMNLFEERTVLEEEDGRLLIETDRDESVSKLKESTGKVYRSMLERLRNYFDSFKEFRKDWKWNKFFQALRSFFGGFTSAGSIDFFTSYMWGTGSLPGNLDPDEVREFGKLQQQLAYSLNILSLPLINQIDKWSKRKVYLVGSCLYSLAYFTPLIYTLPFGTPMQKYMVDRILATISANLFAPFLTSTVSYHERMQVPQEHVAKNLSLTNTITSASAVLGIAVYNLIRSLTFPYLSSVLGIHNANLSLFLIGAMGILTSLVARSKFFIYRESITLEEFSDIVREILEEKFEKKLKKTKINFIPLREFLKKYGEEKVLRAQRNARSLVSNTDFYDTDEIETSLLLKKVDGGFEVPQYSDVAKGIAGIIGDNVFKSFKAYKVLKQMRRENLGEEEMEFYTEASKVLREMYESFVNYSRKLVDKEDLTEKLNMYGVDPKFWKQKKFFNERGVIKPGFLLGSQEAGNGNGEEKFEDILSELEEVEPRKVYEAFETTLNLGREELYELYKSGKLYSLKENLREKIMLMNLL